MDGERRGSAGTTRRFQIERRSINIASRFDSAALPSGAGSVWWRRGVGRPNATAHADSPPHSHSSLLNGPQPLVKRSRIAQRIRPPQPGADRYDGRSNVRQESASAEVFASDSDAGDTPSDTGSASVNTPLCQLPLSPKTRRVSESAAFSSRVSIPVSRSFASSRMDTHRDPSSTRPVRQEGALNSAGFISK